MIDSQSTEEWISDEVEFAIDTKPQAKFLDSFDSLILAISNFWANIVLLPLYTTRFDTPTELQESLTNTSSSQAKTIISSRISLSKISKTKPNTINTTSQQQRRSSRFTNTEIEVDILSLHDKSLRSLQHADAVALHTDDETEPKPNTNTNTNTDDNYNELKNNENLDVTHKEQQQHGQQEEQQQETQETQPSVTSEFSEKSKKQPKKDGNTNDDKIKTTPTNATTTTTKLRSRSSSGVNRNKGKNINSKAKMVTEYNVLSCIVFVLSVVATIIAGMYRFYDVFISDESTQFGISLLLFYLIMFVFLIVMKRHITESYNKYNHSLNTVCLWIIYLPNHSLFNSLKYNSKFKTFVYFYFISMWSIIILTVFYYCLYLEIIRNDNFYSPMSLGGFVIFGFIPIGMYYWCAICATWFEYLTCQQLYLNLKAFVDIYNRNETDLLYRDKVDMVDYADYGNDDDSGGINSSKIQNRSERGISGSGYNYSSYRKDLHPSRLANWFFDIYMIKWRVVNKHIRKQFEFPILTVLISILITIWTALSNVLEALEEGNYRSTIFWSVVTLQFIFYFSPIIVFGCECTRKYKKMQRFANDLLLNYDKRDDTDHWNEIVKIKHGIDALAASYKIYGYKLSWKKVFRSVVVFGVSKVLFYFIEL